MGLEISVKRCAAGIWDELSCTRTFLRKVFTNTKKWSLSSGVVGRRRLFVTNSLKYRDADGFLMALLQHNRSERVGPLVHSVSTSSGPLRGQMNHSKNESRKNYEARLDYVSIRSA